MTKPSKGTDSVLLAPGAAATAVRTANLDTAGANYAAIRLTVGIELNTNSTNVPVRLLESDDTTASNFATFNASYNYTVDNTTNTVATFYVDLEGRKRYLRLEVTPDATTNGVVITSAIATLHKQVLNSTAGELGPNVVIG